MIKRRLLAVDPDVEQLNVVDDKNGPMPTGAQPAAASRTSSTAYTSLVGPLMAGSIMEQT